MHVYLHRYHEKAKDGIGDDGLGYNDQPFKFEMMDVPSERHAAGKYQVLIIESGFDQASVSGISRDELVALRDIINAHLGEKSQTEIVSEVEDSITAVGGYIHDARLRGDREDRHGKEKYRAGLRAATLIAIGPEGGAEEGR